MSSRTTVPTSRWPCATDGPDLLNAFDYILCRRILPSTVSILMAAKTSQYRASYEQRPKAVSSIYPCYNSCESQSLGLVNQDCYGYSQAQPSWYGSQEGLSTGWAGVVSNVNLNIATPPGEFGADNKGIWLSGARCPVCPICPVLTTSCALCSVVPVTSCALCCSNTLWISCCWFSCIFPITVCSQCCFLQANTVKIPWKDITVGTATTGFSSGSPVEVAVIPVKFGSHQIYIKQEVWQLLAKQHKHGIQIEKEDKNENMNTSELVLAATAILPSENMKVWQVVPAAAPAKTYYRNVDTNAVAWNWSAPLPVDATRKPTTTQVTQLPLITQVKPLNATTVDATRSPTTTTQVMPTPLIIKSQNTMMPVLGTMVPS